MKNGKVYLTAFTLFLSLLFTQCTQDTSGLIPSTEQVLVQNAWAIDYYYQNQDMTTDYGSSRILFSSTGIVGFQKNGETIGGIWSRSVDAFNNEVVALQFNTTDPSIMRLNQAWKLSSRSTNSLQFEENTGGTSIVFRLRTQ